MNRHNCSSPGRPVIIPTHNIGVSLPANTKYLYDNPVSRLLIRGFMQTLVDLASRVDTRTVLDVGCGEGLILRQLGTLRDGIRTHGVDISIELLRVAQRVASSSLYLVGNVYQLPLPDHYYDLVICAEVLEHLEDPKSALAEIVRVGKSHCLLSVPHEPWWRIANILRGRYLAGGGNTPGHVKHWSRKSEYLDVVAIRQPFPWTMVLGKVRAGSQG